jgi:L-lactate utilization protein LutC
MADLKKLESFRATHKTILAKTKSNVTVADRSLVEAGYTAYYSILGEVSDATTKLAAEKTKLDDLSAKIRELETEQNKSQAYTYEADEFKRVNAKILAKTKANVAISDKNEVDFAIN